MSKYLRTFPFVREWLARRRTVPGRWIINDNIEGFYAGHILPLQEVTMDLVSFVKSLTSQPETANK